MRGIGSGRAVEWNAFKQTAADILILRKAHKSRVIPRRKLNSAQDHVILVPDLLLHLLVVDRLWKYLVTSMAANLTPAFMNMPFTHQGLERKKPITITHIGIVPIQMFVASQLYKGMSSSLVFPPPPPTSESNR